MSAPIALATAAVARDVDEDLPPLLRAARDAGIEAVAVDWDDASTDWSTFERVVIRSTWDYTQRLEEFLAWTDHVASVSRLVNPASVVAWNCDKRYLAALGAAGLPVVPSWFVGPGDSASIPAGVPEGEIVVKPTVLRFFCARSNVCPPTSGIGFASGPDPTTMVISLVMADV